MYSTYTVHHGCIYIQNTSIVTIHFTSLTWIQLFNDELNLSVEVWVLLLAVAAENLLYTLHTSETHVTQVYTHNLIQCLKAVYTVLTIGWGQKQPYKWVIITHYNCVNNDHWCLRHLLKYDICWTRCSPIHPLLQLHISMHEKQLHFQPVFEPVWSTDKNTTHQLPSLWVQWLCHMTVNTCCFPSKHWLCGDIKRQMQSKNTNCVCFLQAGEDISAISPSLWLPVSQREYTGYYTGLHSHMVESEESRHKVIQTHSLYLYDLRPNGNSLYQRAAARKHGNKGKNVYAVDSNFIF